MLKGECRHIQSGSDNPLPTEMPKYQRSGRAMSATTFSRVGWSRLVYVPLCEFLSSHGWLTQGCHQTCFLRRAPGDSKFNSWNSSQQGIRPWGNRWAEIDESIVNGLQVIITLSTALQGKDPHQNRPHDPPIKCNGDNNLMHIYADIEIQCYLSPFMSNGADSKRKSAFNSWGRRKRGSSESTERMKEDVVAGARGWPLTCCFCSRAIRAVSGLQLLITRGRHSSGPLCISADKVTRQRAAAAGVHQMKKHTPFYFIE